MLLITICNTEYYCAAIAPAGHPPSQAPQSMQESASTTYLPSPSEIAPTGHVDSHAPHIKQSSVITCAIINILLVFIFIYNNTNNEIKQELSMVSFKYMTAVAWGMQSNAVA